MLAFLLTLSQQRDRLVAQTGNRPMVQAFENYLRRENVRETNRLRRELEKAGANPFLLDAFEEKILAERRCLAAEEQANKCRPYRNFSAEQLMEYRTQLRNKVEQLPNVKKVGRPRKNAAEDLQKSLNDLENNIRIIEYEWLLRNFDKLRTFVTSIIEGRVEWLPTKPK